MSCTYDTRFGSVSIQQYELMDGHIRMNAVLYRQGQNIAATRCVITCAKGTREELTSVRSKLVKQVIKKYEALKN